ncbi:Serine/arginine-rich splicing factor 33 [Acorus gramineus]|uniref:Serine/arginine-rich splicing factor 33 n=1 Tax=Acorus gramineus TaxID=55184 RepID=A0AAV9ASV7_ACOGR|nr:Serine/arginine-rich splicing factor 33 [Acorus gramineus]
MRGRSYSYSPSPPRGYGRRGRSPSPRGRYGGRGRDVPTSLLVRNLRHDCRFVVGGVSKLNLQTGKRGDARGDHKEPRGFGFIQYMDPADAAEAKYQMDGQILHGRELTVVFAEENRKKPCDMRARERVSSSSSSRRGRDYRRSPRYSPPTRPRSRSRSHSRSYSPSPRRDDHSSLHLLGTGRFHQSGGGPIVNDHTLDPRTMGRGAEAPLGRIRTGVLTGEDPHLSMIKTEWAGF